MKPKTRLKSVLIVFAAIFFALSVILGPLSQSAHAATGINKRINFQGKVVNTNGTNVSNASYDFVFKIWDDPTAGSTVWTETWNSGTAQIAVTDGVFRAALGTHTTFPGSVDFNTDNLYLSVNFNGDGDMTPRVRFSAVPYAFNAMALGGLNNETITNTVDDELTFTGTGGSVNQAITFDLDDATRSIITSSTSTSIGIDEDLVFIGAQTISTTTGDLTIDSGGTLQIADNTNIAGTLTADTVTADANSGTAFTVSGTSFTTDLALQNGETIDNDVDAQFDFSVNTDTTVTILGSDTVNANTPLTISSSGTGALTLNPTGTGQVVLTSSNASASAVDINATGTVAGAAITLDTTDGGITLTAAGASNGDISLAATDDITINGTAGSIINILTSSAAQTLNLATGTQGNTVNIATDNTTSDTVNVGSALDNIAITSDSWSVTNAGALTVVSCSGCGGGGTTWSTIGDTTSNGAISLADSVQTMDWNTNDVTSVVQDAFTFTFTNDGATDVLTQNVVTIANLDSTGSSATEALLILDNRDTTEAVDDALRITSAAGTILTAIDIDDTDVVTDLELQNADTVSNNTNGTIVFTGVGETNNASFTVDFETNASFPILSSSTDTAIGIDEDLTFVGAQSITTTAGDLTIDSAGTLQITDNTDVAGTLTAGTSNAFVVSAAGNITVAAAEGLDTNGAGALEIGFINATSVSIGNNTGATALNLDAGTGSIDIDSLITTGNLILVGAPSAVTAADGLIGFNLDLQTSYTSTDADVTAASILLDTLDNSAATANIFTGITITGGVVTGNNASAAPLWEGFEAILPDITNTNTAAAGAIVRGFDVETPADTLITAEVSTYAGYSISTVGALSHTTAAGTLNWRGLNFVAPEATVNISGGAVNIDGARIITGNINNTAGTLTENGVNIDMSSTTITQAVGTPTLRGVYVNPGTSENVTSNVLGLEIANLTGAASATEVGMQVGSGWDQDIKFIDTTAVINMPAGGSLTVGDTGADLFTVDLTANTMRLGDGSNGITFDVDGNTTVFAGTARPVSRISLSPEYAGATFTADGGSNTGTMTTDNQATSPYRNFYKWANTQGTAQDYDIWVVIPLPADYSAMASTPTLSIDTYSSDLTNGTVLVTVYDTSSSADCTDVAFTPTGAANTWESKTATTCLDTGTYAANGLVKIKLHITGAATTGDTRVSRIFFDYRSAF